MIESHQQSLNGNHRFHTQNKIVYAFTHLAMCGIVSDRVYMYMTRSGH